MVSAVEVLSPGLLTTVQDAVGRRGYERLGISTGGALDPFAADVASALVGNPPRAALLEVTLVGPRLRFSAPAVLSLAGADLSAMLDGQPVVPGSRVSLRTGGVLTFGTRMSGMRAYLAVAGGFQVPEVLGSPSTDLRAGFGGVEGRALRTGDVLAYTPCAARADLHASGLAADLEASVRILPGPYPERFAQGALETLCATAWRISQQADRMGYRLDDGPRLEHTGGADLTSVGLPVGAIQVPGDGKPIVLLADHQPTGGYTVVATVIRADLPLLAQRRPGDRVRFQVVDLATARAALADQRAVLARLRAEGQ